MTTLSAISLNTPAMMMGVVLITLPIAAHLMNRRTKQHVMFPSIRLLASASAGQSRLFKLRRWWLLLLRCMAVMALVLAFAQPVWLSTQGRVDDGQGAAVVILIDKSASVAQQYAGVTAAHSIRADAGRVLDSLRPGEDSVNIVYATAHPYSAFPTMVSNIDVMRSELESFEPTYERADLTAALAMAGRMLSDQLGGRRIVILTDLQASNWSETLERIREQSPIPKGTRITILPPKHAPPNNLAVHDLSVTPRSPRIGEQVHLTATVINHSDQRQATTVQMRINNQPSESRSLSVEPRQRLEVSFDTVFDQPNDYRVEFVLPSDGMPADDRCYQMVRPTDRPRIIVITDDDVEAPGGAGYFLIRALAPHGGVLDRYEVIRVRSDQTTWPSFANVAAVFIGEIGLLPEARAGEVHHYMEDGGGVVYFCGDGPVAANLSALDRLRPGAVLPWKPTSQRNLTPETDFITINREGSRAPMLNRFDEVDEQWIKQIRVRRAWSGGAVDERAHTVMHYADNTPALVWRGAGSGRLALINISPKATHSDLGKHAWFVVLMQTLADEMRSTDVSTRGGLVGQVVNVIPSTAINPKGGPPVVRHTNHKAPVEAAFSLGDHASTITIRKPATPGFYTTEQDETILAITAINMDPRESDLRRISADEIQDAIHASGVEVDASHDSSGTVMAIGGRPLWGWAMMIALTLFGIEMALLGYWKQ